jgi:hypothetical protein
VSKGKGTSSREEKSTEGSIPANASVGMKGWVWEWRKAEGKHSRKCLSRDEGSGFEMVES